MGVTADGQETRTARCAACGAENRLPRVYCAACGARLANGSPETAEAARERRKRARRRKMRRRARGALLAAFAAVLAAMLWPRPAQVEEGTPAEGAAAGEKLARLLAAAREGRPARAAFTEAEANAWLKDAVRAGNPAQPVRVRVQWREGGAVLTLERRLSGVVPLTQTHSVRVSPEGRFAAAGMSVGHLPLPESAARALRERRLLPQWRAGAADLFRLCGQAAVQAGDGWFALAVGRPDEWRPEAP